MLDIIFYSIVDFSFSISNNWPSTLTKNATGKKEAKNSSERITQCAATLTGVVSVQ